MYLFRQFWQDTGHNGQFRPDTYILKGAWFPFFWNNCPHQSQPFCQFVMWPRGPLTLATGREVLMDRYVGAFTCPLSGRCDYFWQLVCSHFTWLEPTSEPDHSSVLPLWEKTCSSVNHSCSSQAPRRVGWPLIMEFITVSVQSSKIKSIYNQTNYKICCKFSNINFVLISN